MRYPKPGAMGGRLIREVVSTLRGLPEQQELRLPIDSHILIAVSGGVDSMALAWLLTRYGRRVVDRERIRLVHINHGWRGKESDDDEAFVRAKARAMGVPISVFRLKGLDEAVGQSPEEFARQERKRIFEKLSKRYGTKDKPALIFTAHHADDLAETLVWRFCTGALATHGAGILACDGRETRPFLRIRKRDLVTFLKEESETWREDRTNYQGRLLRSRMRLEVMPILEHLFPRLVENLLKMSADAQKPASMGKLDPGILFSAAGIRARRAHWDGLNRRKKETHLPGGWVLKHELDRWILEKP